MSRSINKLAPHLTGTLTPALAERVAACAREGWQNPAACHDADIVRRTGDGDDQASALRPAFVRDIEKIMHVSAYNRLAGKTQVFSFRANDDLCRRGLHEQLVCRVARDIGRALGLNLDLIEAIALGHDIGHTPFGHAGERFLNTVFHERTGRYFFHNVQSVRVLDALAWRNLSLQTLDGVICHNGEFECQHFEMSGLDSFAGFDEMVADCWQNGADAIKKLRSMTLEGCVVRVSDIIAYVGKDRQDAITAGLCSEDTFDDGLGGAYNSWALAAFAADIVENSFGKDCIEMSEEAFAEMRRAKKENYEKIYNAREVNGDFSESIAGLFERLYHHELEALASGDENAAIFAHHIRPVERNLGRYGARYDWEADPDLTVVDFISSMTDAYFMETCAAVFEDARDLFPLRSYFGKDVRP